MRPATLFRRVSYICADRSELPQPSIRIFLLCCAQASQTNGCNCLHSPYHSKAFCLRFWKKPSQNFTERNSSKSSGSKPSKVMLGITPKQMQTDANNNNVGSAVDHRLNALLYRQSALRFVLRARGAGIPRLSYGVHVRTCCRLP